jgi:hypothetical protein
MKHVKHSFRQYLINEIDKLINESDKLLIETLNLRTEIHYNMRVPLLNRT